MLSIFLEIDLALQDAPAYDVIGGIVAIDFLLKQKQKAKVEDNAMLYSLLSARGTVHVVILPNSGEKLDLRIPYWLDV